MNTGREFVGIELDPEYYQMAKERIEKQCGNIRVRIAKTDILAAMTGARGTRQPRFRILKNARALQESVLKQVSPDLIIQDMTGGCVENIMGKC